MRRREFRGIDQIGSDRSIKPIETGVTSRTAIREILGITNRLLTFDRFAAPIAAASSAAMPVTIGFPSKNFQDCVKILQNLAQPVVATISSIESRFKPKSFIAPSMDNGIFPKRSSQGDPKSFRVSRTKKSKPSKFSISTSDSDSREKPIFAHVAVNIVKV
jgi:hypothetical protein